MEHIEFDFEPWAQTEESNEPHERTGRKGAVASMFGQYLAADQHGHMILPWSGTRRVIDARTQYFCLQCEEMLIDAKFLEYLSLLKVDVGMHRPEP